jgi:hypothetical protein
MRSSCDVRSVSDSEWSRVQSAAEKLEGELSEALAEVHRRSDEASRALRAQLDAHARLTRLQKVREKVRSKEHRLVEQGMSELEAEKRKDSN